MMVTLQAPEAALGELREIFRAVEGDCEPWTDDEVVRRVLIRGAMDYAKRGGNDVEEASRLAARLRQRVRAEVTTEEPRSPTD